MTIVYILMTWKPTPYMSHDPEVIRGVFSSKEEAYRVGELFAANDGMEFSVHEFAIDAIAGAEARTFHQHCFNQETATRHDHSYTAITNSNAPPPPERRGRSSYGYSLESPEDAQRRCDNFYHEWLRQKTQTT